MAKRVEDLAGTRGILWTARMSAAGDRWHLAERALPSLKALADKLGEARLHQAAAITAGAADHLVAARDALREALNLIEDD